MSSVKNVAKTSLFVSGGTVYSMNFDFTSSEQRDILTFFKQEIINYLVIKVPQDLVKYQVVCQHGLLILTEKSLD